ncbi:unnamed protein product [Adineta ricciae]|uniref:Uncharacterized protein n=1 Tax=Adineta ricciae TaxID=249248 RepID=A0A814V142_ADIRI|nr:unnamed protein product [Adineta ricciae]CAF1273871.1 unnamed protein product [Adineta ricciae]
MTSTAKFCRKNCGCFGNSALDGLCSRCYTQQKKNDENLEEATQQDTSVVIKSTMPVDSLSLTASTIGNKTRKKTRCPNCHKLLGILQYSCACGGQFCSKCRYSIEHQCPIDYKALGRQFLVDANPQVIADRVPNRQ